MIIDELHKLIKQNNHFYIEGQLIDCLGSANYVDIVLDERHIENESLTFNNVEFLQKVDLRGFKLTGMLSFSNCIFANGLVLNNIECNGLTLYNCVFKGNNTIKIGQNCVFGGISEIAACGRLHSLTIVNSKFYHLIINDCEFEYQYFLRKNYFELELQVEKNTFNCQVRQEYNAFGSFSARSNTYRKNLSFKESSLEQSLYLAANLFEEDIIFLPLNSVGSDSSLSLIDNIFRRGCKFLNYEAGGCKKIYIGSNIFGSGLSISGRNIDSPTPYLEKIDLTLSNTNEGLIKISDINTKELEISGENYKGNIIIRNLRCEELRIESFANYSNFQFINLQPYSSDAKFTITESHLEKVQFVNSRLDKFGSYIIENSNLSLIKSANTKWFTYNQIALNARVISQFSKGAGKGVKKVFSDTKEEIYLEIREIFRQLKYAMDQQGDRVESLKFRSFEMEAYYRYLQLTKMRWDKDRLILFLGKSNDHGINWIRPLVLLFAITIFVFPFLFWAASPDFVFGHGELNLKGFFMALCEHKRVLPQMFNPTHLLHKMFPKDFYISGYALTIDVIYKIVFSYLVFQTISAFRKFIK